MRAVNLGDKAKDIVTGFTGVVVAEITYLNGCRRLALQPQELGKDGVPVEERFFDEQQLELVTAGVVPFPPRQQPAAVESAPQVTGGARPAPAGRTVPSRDVAVRDLAVRAGRR